MEYGKTAEKVFKESSEEEEGDSKDDRKEEKEEDEYVCAIMKVKSVENEKVKDRMIWDIKEILEELNKERSQVADIVRVVMTETDDEDVKKGLGVMYLMWSQD